MAVHASVLDGGAIVLRLTDQFQASDAWEVHELLQRATQGSAILDFSRVDRFEDFAVALLAPDLVSAKERHIRIRGLGSHQARLLRYLGVEQLTSGEPATNDGD